MALHTPAFLHMKRAAARLRKISTDMKTHASLEDCGIWADGARGPRRERARAHKETLIVIQPGGAFVDVTVQGTDITKIRECNIAMAEARPRDGQPGNRAPLNRFMRRYKRYYVTDVDTGERVVLIMSREELDRSKAQMNMPTREEVDRRYSEDMAET